MSIIITLVLHVLATAGVESKAKSSGELLIEWLRAKQGFFNANVEIRRGAPSDTGTASKLGLFSIAKIPKDELILSIPPSCLISSEGVHRRSRREQAWHPVRSPNVVPCNTVQNLIREMKLGNESEFAPYVNYLLGEANPRRLPSAWSEAGQALLMEILGSKKGDERPPFEAVDWILEWQKGCGHSEKDSFADSVASLVIQKSWGDVLVPVYDMMSHRNGAWLNTQTKSISHTSVVEVRASRDIEVGEELYTTYHAGVGVATKYGTPEILRDFGFVEQYPQQWIFPHHSLAFQLDQKAHDVDSSPHRLLELSWIGKAPSNEVAAFLQTELKRLNDLALIEFDVTDDVVPIDEWHVIWQYHQALLAAMSQAMDGVLNNSKDESLNARAQPEMHGYDELLEEADDLRYDETECHHASSNQGSETMDEVTSHYQAIDFYMSEQNDVCLYLDNTMQICGSYRPHYHELMVHYTARFLDKVERVLFVGGGDSMLLHEILKYPHIQLVIGLELDQQVTRYSFKHFGTQPHWDNPKVEWWYGDAAKSMLMLPKKYFGTFDMVLVDLSETVAALPVTGHLDVMEALAMLLKPEGILVKNELYLGKMSEIFDHSIQIHHNDVPMLCTQEFVMGSTDINFIDKGLKDHRVQSLLLETLDNIEDRYELFHDYRRNRTSMERYCKGHSDPDEGGIEQKSSPGILVVVEAEDAVGVLHPPEILKDVVLNALKEVSVSVISTVTLSSDTANVMAVVLNSGYILVRAWPDHKYCAFDIHMWSSFEKDEHIKGALIAAVGSNIRSSSSYRIVVGGMFAVGDWRTDYQGRGPHSFLPCSSQVISELNSPPDESAVATILEETMNIFVSTAVVVLVLCGHATESCRSLDILSKHDRAREVVALWTCPELKSSGELADMNLKRNCQKSLKTRLVESMSQANLIGSIIVDPSTTFAMAQIVYTIFSSKRTRQRMLMPNMLVMATMIDNTETWRRNLLERFRKNIFVHEPVFRAEVLLKSSTGSLEMGVTVSGDTLFIKHLVDAKTNIAARSGLVPEVRSIQGGLWDIDPKFAPSTFFESKDYDQQLPLAQWLSQRPLGHQVLLQLEPEGGNHTPMSTIGVRRALQSAIQDSTDGSLATTEIHEFTSIGDGCVLVALWQAGSVIVLWDGRIHIDINVFVYSELAAGLANDISVHFNAEIPSLTTVLRDEQPRGFGRVVNFKKDIAPNAIPHWAKGNVNREEL